MNVLPAVPIEVWENIIDELRSSPSTLQACALVCRAWHPRSRVLLLKQVLISERDQVYHLAELARESAFHAEAVKTVTIRGSKAKGEPRPIPHLGTFASMLARVLTRVEVLALVGARWQAGGVHDRVFLHLSAFTSITWLTLDGATFPTLQSFGRLICALPNLNRLDSKGLTFVRPSYDVGRLSKCASSTKIACLILSGSSVDIVIDLFVNIGLAANLEEVWLGNHAQPIQLRDMASLGIPRLLLAAGETLREVIVTLWSPAEEPGVTLIQNILLIYVLRALVHVLDILPVGST